MALRPRLSPGVPLSRDGKAELPAGTRAVKQIGGRRLLVRSASELQVRGPHMRPLSLCVEPDIARHGSGRNASSFRSSTGVHTRGRPGCFHARCGGTRAQR